MLVETEELLGGVYRDLKAIRAVAQCCGEAFSEDRFDDFRELWDALYDLISKQEQELGELLDGNGKP